MTSSLSPAGSSQYKSPTMFVGDGTWDSERNSFLLPNLVGLNFETMRYNGMGNRFKDLPQYHILIRGHAVIAAITFLFIVPAAILTVRFSPHRRAIRVHVWLQILTVLLSTAVFSIGWLAVGPERSLTNPHHGIGLAIYVLVLAQAIGGWWIHHKASTKRISDTFKAMVHHWFGRMIALLGLAQIPLGLTIYGSPKYLFILYALAAFALLSIFFFLSYAEGRRSGSDYGSYSYGTGSATSPRRRSSTLGGLAKAGIAGAGMAALSSRFRNRSRDRRSRSEVLSSRRHSESYVGDEKDSRHGRYEDRGAGWKDWFLKMGAIAGGVALAKKLMGRKDRDEERDSDESNYGPPLGGSVIPEGRLEEGRPLPTSRRPLNHRRSHSSMTYDSYTSASGERRQGHGLRNTVAGLGAFSLARNIFKKRRDRKEARRLETQRRREIDEERRARANNQRLTGDGFSRRNVRRTSNTTSTDFSGSTNEPRYDPGVPPPIPAGLYPDAAAGAAAGLAAGAVLAGQNPDRDRHPNINNPSNPTLSNGPPLGSVQVPQIPPDPQRGLYESSGSEAYASAGARQHRRRSGRHAPAPFESSAAGLAVPESSTQQDPRRQSGSGVDAGVASPPISIKVKINPEGREITLRRLPEVEAAAERSRRSKERHGRRRKGSMNSLSGSDGGGNRWRRKEAQRQQEAQVKRPESQNPPPLAQAYNQTQPLPMPTPPPAPAAGSSTGRRPGVGSVGSPGTILEGTPTEASATYRDNRKRRRAERSQAQLAKEGRQAASVEFT